MFIKKEVVFLFIVLILLTGCVQTQQGIATENPFAIDSYIPETYLGFYTFNKAFLPEINLAIENDNEEECNKAATLEGKKECSIVFKKLQAFKLKDYNFCQQIWYQEELYQDPNGKEKYDECTAPIVTYSAINIKNTDTTYCKQHLTTPKLISLCEENYGKYS
ncbi:MAG: hypothetical protein KKG75_00345 [Nanoarchaeota archaeon]|nr:hypothetical protein [Nanoarchaeota archaeon]